VQKLKSNFRGLLATAAVLFIAGATGQVQALAQADKTILIKNVDEPARQPFQQQCQSTPATSCNISVPAGKRLVVEAINGLLRFPTNTVNVSGGATVTRDGIGLGYLFAPQALSKGAGGDFYVVDRSIRLYVDGFISFFSNSSIGTASESRFVVSGYLIDVP